MGESLFYKNLYLKEYQQRKSMNAQKYDSVTIYFRYPKSKSLFWNWIILNIVSDLVDFIQMVEESSPAEMVIFLNSFYKMFDSRLSKYDIFKVCILILIFFLLMGTIRHKIAC